MSILFKLYQVNGAVGQSVTAQSGTSYTTDSYGMVTGVSAQDVNSLESAGFLSLGPVQGRDNLVATTDPTVSNDNTQDYAVGSIWVNSSNGRVWIAQAVGTGAAAWALAIVPGTGVEPSSNLEQFGSGIGTMLAEGNIYRNTFASANPGGTGGDYVLAAYSLPAGSFDIAGRGINLVAMGSVANNTNAKRMKLYYGCTTATVGSLVSGGTVIADTGSYTTTGAAGWQVEANVFKYGAAASNTQLGLHMTAQIGSTVGALLSPTALNSTESGAIIVAVTGNATTTATDIIYNFFEVNAMN